MVTKKTAAPCDTDMCDVRIVHIDRVARARSEAIDANALDRLVLTYKIMGDPTRLKSILALRGGFIATNDESRGLHYEDKYQIMAAGGWGGAQWKDNIYEVSGSYPSDVCHQATFEDPANSAFWSFTVYNKAGFMFNDLANVNSDLATANADGTYTVSLGCGADAPNRIPISNESGVFNVTIRHYRPSDRVIAGYRLAPTVKKIE